MWLLLLLACRTATVVNACDEDPSWCLPCASDRECVLMGNPCLETVYCAQEGAQIATIEIGCSDEMEYVWPEASTCTCQSGFCAP